MSIPPPLTVAVICQEYPHGGEIAVASCKAMEMLYLILKPVSEFGTYRRSFLLGSDKNFIDLTDKYKLFSPIAVDPHRVDLWLAMDAAGEQLARKMVEEAGESPYQGMYARTFPDKVSHCGFTVPALADDGNFKEWLDSLREHLAPWRKQFGRIMSDAS